MKLGPQLLLGGFIYRIRPPNQNLLRWICGAPMPSKVVSLPPVVVYRYVEPNRLSWAGCCNRYVVPKDVVNWKEAHNRYCRFCAL